MSRGSRSNYWSSSKFSKWIQKTFADTTKPYALPLGEWGKWDKAFKDAHPFVHWITEDCFDWVQNVVNYPIDVLDDVRYWGYNRFVSKPHVLNTKLKKGGYHEIDTRMLHGMFETLVDYVEVEKAWMSVVWDEAARKTYQLPWYKRVPYWMRWRVWRCPEAGIDHLKWEMSLVNKCEWLTDEERTNTPDCGLPTPQAVAAKEIYELYNWWKYVRPNRADPYDESGWSAHCDHMRKDADDLFLEEKTEEEKKACSAALNKLESLEAQYDREDEEMLIRLIRIRHHLWT